MLGVLGLASDAGITEKDRGTITGVSFPAQTIRNWLSPTGSFSPRHSVGEAVTLANGLTISVELTANTRIPLMLQASGFRRFTDPMALDHAVAVVGALKAARFTVEASTSSTTARIEIEHPGPSTDYRTIAANHLGSPIRMTRVHFTPPSHFASNIYDLDIPATATLIAALQEGISSCR